MTRENVGMVRKLLMCTGRRGSTCMPRSYETGVRVTYRSIWESEEGWGTADPGSALHWTGSASTSVAGKHLRCCLLDVQGFFDLSGTLLPLYSSGMPGTLMGVIPCCKVIERWTNVPQANYRTE
jgi:hypothetical protein